ncbi:hypothetical protein VOI46_18815 (plasmid) [Pseudoalteromonas sp. CuT4-3]|jgi:hypothetical protein|nr:hypothetical protein [Pseudoalteromonas sp. CuT 4-3]WRU74762.1 hypothetical protein VOI46_18815 [Pseudoalteromonas sp. CuT 4-3]
MAKPGENIHFAIKCASIFMAQPCRPHIHINLALLFIGRNQAQRKSFI